MKRIFLLFVIACSSWITAQGQATYFNDFNTDPSLNSVPLPQRWDFTGGAWNSTEGGFLITSGNSNTTRFVTNEFTVSNAQTLLFQITTRSVTGCGGGNSTCSNYEWPADCVLVWDIIFVPADFTSSSNTPTPAENLNNGDIVIRKIITNNSSPEVLVNVPTEVSALNGPFRMFFQFRIASGADITQDCKNNALKIKFDDFKLLGADYVDCDGSIQLDCPPEASDDLFFANSLLAQGHLWGDNSMFAGLAVAPYQAGSYIGSAFVPNILAADPSVDPYSSLTFIGLDDDPNNPETLTWTLDAGSVRVLVGTPGSTASVTVNPNGTFSAQVTGGDVYFLTFTYTIQDAGGNTSTARVYILFPTSSLPVNWGAFTAVRNKDKVLLNWETLTESNNMGFIVERKDEKGDFYQISFVMSKAPQGNSSARLAYDFTDNNSNVGLTQYRLIQVDKDGSRRMSEVRVVKGLGKSSQVMIYPNPSQSGNVTLQFGDSQRRNVYVTDVNGRTLQGWSGYTQQTLQIRNLATGIYFVRIQDETTGQFQVERVVVSRQ